MGQGSKIEIVNANALLGGNALPNGAKRLIGNVQFKHEGAKLYCDSSWYYPNENRLEAFGNVRIKQGDTLDLRGKYLEYSGQSKKALVTGGVRFRDKSMTLETDRLDYDRKNQHAYYQNGGVIVDEDNRLRSERGSYFSRSKQFFFADSVVLVNPKYTIFSDTLLYNTRSKRADFAGETRIESDSNLILCRRGFYNTKTNLSAFFKGASLIQGEQRLNADSLFYDRNRNYGEAYRKVTVHDTLEGISLYGDFGKYFGNDKDSRIFGERAYLAIQTEDDSLFMHADSLHFYEDSSFKSFDAFPKVRFYQSDFQGLADTVYWSERDSLMHFIEDPIVWADGQQLTADTMFALIDQGKISWLKMVSSAILISKDTLNDFNQIQGGEMKAYFKDNTLNRILVEGNAQSVFFAREDDGSFIGLDLAKSSRMTLWFKNSDLDRIVYGKDVNAQLKPSNSIEASDRRLQNFEWRIWLKPNQKSDIFIQPINPISKELETQPKDLDPNKEQKDLNRDEILDKED